MHAFYHFHGNLTNLLRRRWRGATPIIQPVTRSASIKDVIESFGVPHTEVGSILCDGLPVNFSRPVAAGQRFDIHPIPVPWEVTQPTPLRPRPLQGLGFVVDINAGRLASYLRMAGFDTLYDSSWDNAKILQVLQLEPRILLTRSLDLLKRKQVEYGRYIRTDAPVDQLREVSALFGIGESRHSFSRCLQCNTVLQPVPKQEILHRLEPLTIRYVESFSICGRCDKIYWKGSHVTGMQRVLEGR
jgi:hypothetical protein